MSTLQFETPENVQVQYRTAGLGTRFVAWVADQIFVTLLTVLLFCGLAMVGSALLSVLEDWVEAMSDADPANIRSLGYVFVGIGLLAWGLGSFFYFGLCELLLRGQTPGKRIVGIRVIKVDGFSLSPLSIFLRNIFRVADHLPPMWLIPFLSPRAQRAGDMVAGTLVIADNPEDISPLRERLVGRSPLDSQFRFGHAQLAELQPSDFEAVERILERIDDLPEERRTELLAQSVGGLTGQLSIDPPPAEQHRRFMEDLLAAEYRRQSRQLH